MAITSEFTSVDSRIMNRNMEEEAAREIRADQVQARREEENELSDDELKEELRESLEDIARKRSVASALEHGVKLGFILRQEINDLRFDGLVFWFVLGISFVKDFSDLFTGTLGGIFTNWFIPPILFIVFFLRKSYLKKYIIKKIGYKFFILVIAEFLPVTSGFPNYLISTILLRMNVDKKRRKKDKELELLEEEIKKLKA
ncbi:hypothetical protein C0583_00895 [Candidatus Parcubacteria bacterium]|nr:MAG: hypothetical protein C0583_00895 [Candidatus Parcubacteria bacterium]